MSQISPQPSSLPPTSRDVARNVSTGANPLQHKVSWLYSFWKFSRPHTIIGTSLSVLGLYAIAIASSHRFSPDSLTQLLGTWMACLCGNVYIVGLNQLEDVEIDRINKPHLPIAAGEFSRSQAKAIVGITGVLALVLAGVMGPFLLLMVGISLAIGTAYSLPPIRLKRFPIWASFCIFTVRGAVVNLGIFLHFISVFDKLNAAQLEVFLIPAIPSKVWALTLFIIAFTLAIATVKDIPDMKGDRQYNISTFTIQLGAPVVFNFARWLLTACYLGMTLAGILWLSDVNSIFLVITQLLALGLMWWRSTKVDLKDREAIAQFYQFIWKLFFMQYIVFPVACLLNYPFYI